MTGLHALEQIAETVNEKTARGFVAVAWKAICAMYLARGTFPCIEKLSQLRTRYEHLVDADESGWAYVIERASVDKEEHNIKLVYVLRLHWRRYGQRSFFRHTAEHFV